MLLTVGGKIEREKKTLKENERERERGDRERVRMSLCATRALNFFLRRCNRTTRRNWDDAFFIAAHLPLSGTISIML